MAKERVKFTVKNNISTASQIIDEEFRNEMVAFGEHFSGAIQQKLREKDIVAFGGLIGSWAPVYRGKVGDLVWERVASTVEYSGYVEFGTAPHWPPLEPIFRWVEKKFRTISMGVEFSTGKARPTGRGKNEPRDFATARRFYNIARAIQRKIKAHGTVGRHYMAEVFSDMGIPAKAEPVGAEMVYKADLNVWLETNTGLAGRIQSRIGGLS